MSKGTRFHLGLQVADVNASISFYSTLFNIEPVKVKADYAKFELDNPGLVISLVKKNEGAYSGFGHMGFRAVSQEELDKTIARVKQKLELSLVEEMTACCYTYQNKFWVKDPDGHEWEIYHSMDDSHEIFPSIKAAY